MTSALFRLLAKFDSKMTLPDMICEVLKNGEPKSKKEIAIKLLTKYKYEITTKQSFSVTISMMVKKGLIVQTAKNTYKILDTKINTKYNKNKVQTKGE